MLTRYITAAMERAHYEPVGEGGYFGSIPGLDGAWGSGPTLEACRKELAEVLGGLAAVPPVAADASSRHSGH